MENRPVKIGVIGTGNMGKNHVRITNEESALFELVALHDANAETAYNMAETFGVHHTKSIEELLGMVEAVVIAAPSSLHTEIALMAAQRGVHALVEKPLALTVADAEKICIAFAKAEKVLMVGHVERYNPVMIELQKILKNEQVIAIDAHRCSPFDGRISDADVISDLMIHDIDLLCNGLVQERIVKLQAHGKNVASKRNLDYVQALVDFDGGIMGSITASRITEDKIRTVDVHTRTAYIHADLLTRTLQIARRTNYSLDTGYAPTYRQENIIEKVMVPMFEPLKKELAIFADCIRNNRIPPTKGEDAVRSIDIATQIRELSQEG